MAFESLRCYVEPDGGRWKAYCVEVELAASAATPAQARMDLDRKLERHCHEAREAAGAIHPLRRRSLARQLRYWRACMRRDAHGESCGYWFRTPPELLMGLA
jgi:hypothetical protein